VIDGAELRQLLERYNPGPKLVPGTAAVEDRSLPGEPPEGDATAAAGTP
jgi:hypothetical protein